MDTSSRRSRENPHKANFNLYMNFYNDVMDKKIKDIEGYLKEDMKKDIEFMKNNSPTIDKPFNNFILLYNYLNTLKKDKTKITTKFDFRINNEDFKSDEGVLNEEAINFNKKSGRDKISNTEMINRFIIDNYIIHSKSINGLKIKTATKINNVEYEKLYNIIDNEKSKINDLLNDFTLDKYLELNTSIRNNISKNKLQNLISNIYNGSYNFLLIKKLKESNFGYYIINIILINKILDEIDFFEFMMLQRILAIFDKEFVDVLKQGSIKKGVEISISNIIKTAEIDDPNEINGKFFIYFTVISLYNKFLKSESKNQFNLYKLAYESYYIKSLLSNTSQTSQTMILDNRVKYYNFMFKNPIEIGSIERNVNNKEGRIERANKQLIDNEEQYNKGLLHYLNIAAVCLLKDNNIEILYNGTPIEDSETKGKGDDEGQGKGDDEGQGQGDDNKLIKLLNDLTSKSNSEEFNKDFNKELSIEFLDFISNEFFSNNYRIRINEKGYFKSQKNTK